MLNHQDTKGTKKTKNIFGLVFQHQIFAFLGALGALVVKRKLS
jgi:hypothetical protein